MFPYFARRCCFHVVYQTPIEIHFYLWRVGKEILGTVQTSYDTVKNAMSLSGLFYGPNESLKTFMNRFNIVVTRMSNPNEDTMFAALVRAIHSDVDFERWIKMKQPAIIKEFNRRWISIWDWKRQTRWGQDRQWTTKWDSSEQCSGQAGWKQF